MNMTCEQLSTELEVVSERLEVLSDRQRANRERDIILNALVIPGLGAAAPNQEAAIAQTKGEIEAIQRESQRCPATAADSQPDATWRGLEVSPENRCTPYDRIRLPLPSVTRASNHRKHGRAHLRPLYRAHVHQP